MQREKVRMRKVNSNGSYTASAVTVHNIAFTSFWANFKGSFYTGNLPSKVSLRVAVENDCSYRVEENETFKILKISSTLWFRSISEAIGCFRYISFRLRGSLGEEWNNKRTTHRTRISPSLFFLRQECLDWKSWQDDSFPDKRQHKISLQEYTDTYFRRDRPYELRWGGLPCPTANIQT